MGRLQSSLGSVEENRLVVMEVMEVMEELEVMEMMVVMEVMEELEELEVSLEESGKQYSRGGGGCGHQSSLTWTKSDQKYQGRSSDT